MKPLIGLTGPSTFTQECIDVIEEFLEADFVLLYHSSSENLKHWLEEVDGVIVAGGVDIHPTIYGQSVWSNHNLSKFDLRRDCRELKIVEYCLDHGKPMLGICRGHQILGLTFGMELIVDISPAPVCHQPSRQNIQLGVDEPAHSIKIINQELFAQYKMPLDVEERRQFKKVAKDKDGEKIWVNSFHHQGVRYYPKRDYPGLNIIGTAKIDMELAKEIVELMQGDRWLSCQWHPEYDWRCNTASRVVLSRFRSLLS